MYKNSLIEEEFVIFVCSTTGQGTEPANMKVKKKKRERQSECYGGLIMNRNFGDSYYVRICLMIFLPI